MSTLSMPAQLARCSTTAAVRRPVKSRDEVDLRSMVKADHVRRGTDVAAYLSSMLAAKPLRSVRPLSVAGSTRRRQSDCDQT
jgi:hypothetical protein